ncbi:MAG: helix-turn-helix domain-containing protein [Armatimonadota bacterium]|nr:helix-turn-helix domain-containing protein [Armatimonadota bacterium]MDR7519471.1 helix-turn-helix domain-containing protein [Armatimonadota bacterium]MDR7549168.1 helix-turn-helix domain-containing protein [Armatimonadota bacterium]
MARERSGRWLSLGEAAAWLGVDEATLRHWADTGRVRTFRTPGGHRRFLEDDLHSLIAREIPRVDDLGHLVERRSARVLAGSPARPLETRAWFASLDETLRARARAYGRQVFGEVVRYVAEPAARREIRERVLAAGRQYGIDLRDAGVTPAEAAEAFGHFRNLVLKLVTEPRGRGGMLDEEQIRTLLEVSGVLDAIFAAILRAWDRQERTAHGTPAPAGPGATVP